MIIQCPSCSTKFKFPDEKVKPGVKVRCSKCKNVFELQAEAAGQAAPPPAPGPGPSAPPPPPAPGPPPSEDKFNFGGGFDFGEEEKAHEEASTERKPMTPAHQDFAVGIDEIKVEDKPAAKARPAEEPSEESEEFSFEDEADFSSEEFGASAKPQPKEKEKEMNLGFSSEMPEIPGPAKAPGKGPGPAEESEAGGEGSFEDNMGDFKIDRGEEIPTKEAKPAKAGAEEFDFSDKLESYARTETSRKKPSAGDDLEAQLDSDNEAAPSPAPAATAQVRDFPPATAARPVTRVIEAKEKGGGLKKFLVFLLVIIILAPVGGLFYLNSTKSFTFADLSKGDFKKLMNAPELQQILIALGLRQAEIKGEVVVDKDSIRPMNLVRRDGSAALAVLGKARNDYPVPVGYVQVQVDLYDDARNLLASGYSYCDVNFTKNEMENMSEAELQGYMETKAGRNMNNLEIKPGEQRDFAVIFFKPPREVRTFDPKVVNNFQLIKPGG